MCLCWNGPCPWTHELQHGHEYLERRIAGPAPRELVGYAQRQVVMCMHAPFRPGIQDFREGAKSAVTLPCSRTWGGIPVLSSAL